VSVASRPSTRAKKIPFTQLVFVTRGVSSRSTPCVCALRGFLSGREFPYRTTRRHGVARPPPNWVGWAERVVTPPAARAEIRVLTVDTCGTRVGSALLEEQDDGKVQPGVYISRRLTTNELPYEVMEKECPAVVWASLKFRPYLESDRFLVRTEHECLR